MKSRILVASVAASLAALVSVATPANASTTTCRNALYSDGKTVVRACVVWTAGSGTSWTVSNRYVWNPTVADGGHSDTTYYQAWQGSGSHYVEDDNITDGDTENAPFAPPFPSWSEGSNTVWVQVESTYDAAHCYRVFFANGGSTSTTVVNNPC